MPNVIEVKPQKGGQTKALACSADILIYGGEAGAGKGQPLDGPVWTPWGTREMGSLSVGDKVLGRDGRPTTIVRIHELGVRPIFRVRFRDGSSLETTEDHLWLAWKGHIRTPSEARLVTTDNLKAGHRIPLCGPTSSHVTNRWRDRRIDPYDMGLLLGDGCFRAKGVQVSIHSPDVLSHTSLDLGGVGPDYSARGIVEETRRLGLQGLYSYEKFVPEEYLNRSPEDRLKLFQGYMDADGTVSSRGQVTFTTTSPRLRDGMVLIAESLGCVASVGVRQTYYTDGGRRKKGRESWRVRVKTPEGFKPFTIPKKLARCRPFQSLSREIVSVERTREAPARCISVSEPDGLYIAGDRPIVTHNTWTILAEPLRHVRNPSFYGVIFRRESPNITRPGGLWDTSAELYPLFNAQPRKSPVHSWKFPSGARIEFHHLQYANDVHNWQGAQVPYFAFDQLEEFEESQFWYMISRLRSMSGVRPYVRATVNPDPDSFVASLVSWWIDPDTGYPIPERDGVLRWFVRRDDALVWFDSPEEAQGRFPGSRPMSFTFIRGKLEENRKLMDVDPEYEAKLEALPYVQRMRLLGGNWKVRESAGNVFNRSDFKIRDIAPAKGEMTVRYWDKAGTDEKEATSRHSRSAGVRIKMTAEGEWWVEDVVAGYWSAFDRERVIRQVAEGDGDEVDEIWVEQEPGSGGKESAENTVRNLKGFPCFIERVTGDKLSRARPFAAQVEAGNVYLVRAPWNEDFLKEYHNFTGAKGQAADLVDAGSGSFNKTLPALPKPKTKVKLTWGA